MECFPPKRGATRDGGVKTPVDAADARSQQQLLPPELKVPLKDTVSGEGEGEGEEEQQRPTCPPAGLAAGPTSISPLADRRLSHFLRITLRIYESSPSLGWKTEILNGTDVPLDATETGQEQTRKREVEDVERIRASFPATQNKRNLENCQARSGPMASLAPPFPPFLSASSPLPLS